MRPSSAKAKGRRFQQLVRDALLEGSTLHPDDIRSTAMGQNGEDIQLSPAARKIYPYSFECKCVEKLNIWEGIEQATENAGQHTPALAFSRNNQIPWIAIPLDVFIKLHKGSV